MTLVLVVNYGFLSSFKNVLPNSNLLARKFTFHNTAFTVQAKEVTFEVTSLTGYRDERLERNSAGAGFIRKKELTCSSGLSLIHI